MTVTEYYMCSLAVSTQDFLAVEPRSNPGSGKILMIENLRLYTTSPVVMCHWRIEGRAKRALPPPPLKLVKV